MRNEPRFLRCFFELLKAGMGLKPANSRLFVCEEDDWIQILRFAEEQAVIALVWDGVLSLPAENHPPKSVFYEWLGKVLSIEKSNERMNLVLSEIIKLVQPLSEKVILMKGQGTGALYPFPLHRQCGDIDIYAGRNGFQLLNTFFTEKGFIPGKRSAKHTGYTYRGIEIENHRYISLFFSPFKARRFKKIIGEWYPHQFQSRTVGQTLLHLPPSWFEGLLAVIHFAFHLHLEGVGLRQLCDWYVILQQKDLDRVRYKKALQQLGLCRMEKIMQEICTVCLETNDDFQDFNNPIEEFRFTPAAYNVYKAICEGGNFGQYGEDFGTHSHAGKGSYWKTLFALISHDIQRGIRFYRLFPSEALLAPFFRAGGYILRAGK